jgi:hypothetical protein
MTCPAVFCFGVVLIGVAFADVPIPDCELQHEMLTQGIDCSWCSASPPHTGCDHYSMWHLYWCPAPANCPVGATCEAVEWMPALVFYWSECDDSHCPFPGACYTDAWDFWYDMKPYNCDCKAPV